VKLAHRLAHSLKGNAGQIGETKLQYIAGSVESMLQKGTIPSADIMSLLKTELSSVLEELSPLLDEPETRGEKTPLNKEQTRALFEKLKSLLESRNIKCLDLLDDIHCVPGAEELAFQIDRCDFKSAAAALEKLMDEDEKGTLLGSA